MMRLFMSVVMLVAAASVAYAQPAEVQSGSSTEAEGECQSVSPTDQVVVSTAGGQTVRGTLMCMSDSRVWLLRDGGMSRIDLSRVQRIRTPADPVWDGAVIGAAIPLIFWAVLCHDCPADDMLRVSLTYGAIGLMSDAVNTNRRTLYRARPSLAVGWSLKF